MRVLVGNKRPKVGHKLPNGTTEYEFLPPGDYVTEVRADDLANITGALTLHFLGHWDEQTFVWEEKPTWVSCEDERMQESLCKYWGISDNTVPAEWLQRGGFIED
jgi:hypothetical protein